MRTNIKKQRVLMREAREALGVRRNADVYTSIRPIAQAVDVLLPCSAAVVSHYKDSSWGVCWLDDGCRERFIKFTAESLSLSPGAFVERILPYAVTRSCKPSLIT